METVPKIGRHFQFRCAEGDPMSVHYLGGSPPRLRLTCSNCGIDVRFVLDMAFGFPEEPSRAAAQEPALPLRHRQPSWGRLRSDL
jgi:hypothetical protein